MTGITSKQQNIGAFSGDFLSENDLEAVLAVFYCYDYGANASEAIEIFGYIFGMAKRTAGDILKLAQKSNNWFIMSFIQSRSQIRVYRAAIGNKLAGIDTYNQFYKILRLFDVLPNFPSTISETMCRYYL